jgi:antitoxin Phd
MAASYSIAEARDRFARIVHDLERTRLVQVTRRGRLVAVLVSVREYERLRSGRASFWPACERFRASHDLRALGLEADVFAGVRDPSPGREPPR